MSEYTSEHLRVAATPQDCFAVAVALELYPEWVADLKQVSIESRDEQDRPLEVSFRAAAFGRSTNYSLRYDYSEAPVVLAWKQISGDITSKLDGSYRFSADGDGTDVTYELTVELKVPIPGFIKSRAQSRIQTTALRELRARVESQS